MVVCLEQDAGLHMAQLMPLPLTVSCFSKIQIGFTFLVPVHPGSPGQRAIKRVCVCVLSTELIRWMQAASGAAGWANVKLCTASSALLFQSACGHQDTD